MPAVRDINEMILEYDRKDYRQTLHILSVAQRIDHTRTIDNCTRHLAELQARWPNGELINHQ